MEQLALSAEQGRVISSPTDVIKQTAYSVVVPIRCVEAAGGDHDGLLAVRVIAGGMTAAASLAAILRHEGEDHGKLPVNEAFQRSRHRKVVQWKAPDRHIRP